MGKILDRIIQQLHDRNCLFVFSSEIVAESWMRKVVCSGPVRAVRADRFLSWDTFSRLYLDVPGYLKPSGPVSRRLFTSGLLIENSRESFLRAIVPPQHAGDYRMFESSVCRIIPSVAALDLEDGAAGRALKLIPESFRHDISMLAIRYREFLDTHDLYEQSFLNTRLLVELGSENFPARESAAAGMRFMIFFPETVPGLMQVLAGRDSIGPVEVCCTPFSRDKDPAGQPDNPGFDDRQPGAPPFVTSGDTLSVYEHAGVELVTLFTEIEKLVSGGTDPGDIAVTVGSLDSWERELRAAAKMRGLPVHLRNGRPVTTHPVTRIFRDLQDAVQQDFSLESLKRLLLNRSCPWLNRERGEALVSFGAENSCVRNYRDTSGYHDVWEEKLKRAGKDDLLEYYHGLTGSLLAFVRCDDIDEGSKGLERFWNGFLDKDRWGCHSDVVNDDPGVAFLTDEQRLISFCLDNLAEFTRFCTAMGFASLPGWYSTWLSILDSVNYNAQEKQGSIAIFPYGVSAGITPGYHFIIGTTQAAVEKNISPLSFLQEQYRDDIQDLEQDLTNSLLETYAISGARVSFSCSRRDFEGAQLPSGYFIEQGAVIDMTSAQCRDSLVMERLYWEECSREGINQAGAAHQEYGQTGKSVDQTVNRVLFPGILYPAQADGFTRALATVLQDPGYRLTEGPFPDAGMLKEAISRLENSEGVISLSPTAVDAFADCPMEWFFTRLLRIDDGTYTIQYDDPRIVGNLIHDCYADFYRNIAGDPAAAADYADPGAENRGRFTGMLQESIDACLQRLRRRADSPPLPVLDWMGYYLKEHLGMIIAADAKHLAGWKTLYTEKPLTSQRNNPQYELGGRIDRAACILAADDSESSELRGHSLAVIDYKKSTSVRVSSFNPDSDKPDSLQLPIYAVLLEGEQDGDRVTHAMYYDVTKQKYTEISGKKAGGRENLRRLMDMALHEADDMCRKILAGDFRVVNDTERCGRCRIRAICRGRFAVQ